LPPSSGSKGKPSKSQQEAGSNKLCSSKMSVNFYSTIRHYSSEHSTFHSPILRTFSVITFYIKFKDCNGIYTFSHRLINTLFVQCGREPTMGILKLKLYELQSTSHN
jgi:hypothetical protein